MPRCTSERRKLACEGAGYPSFSMLPAAQDAPRPARGVRLKVVSTFTMLFALLCLAALLAGRTEMPVEAATDASYEPAVCSSCSARSTVLRNDDARRVGINGGSAHAISLQRKPRPKKRNKRARSWAPVSLRSIHPQQKDQ